MTPWDDRNGAWKTGFLRLLSSMTLNVPDFRSVSRSRSHFKYLVPTRAGLGYSSICAKPRKFSGLCFPLRNALDAA
jgi:hypothetical protein